MAKETVYILKEPVMLGSEEVTQVTIARKLKHLRHFSLRAGEEKQGGAIVVNIDFGTLIDLGARMIGRLPAELEEFGEEDQSEIMGAARDFLFMHLGTGSRP